MYVLCRVLYRACIWAVYTIQQHISIIQLKCEIPFSSNDFDSDKTKKNVLKQLSKATWMTLYFYHNFEIISISITLKKNMISTLTTILFVVCRKVLGLFVFQVIVTDDMVKTQNWTQMCYQNSKISKINGMINCIWLFNDQILGKTCPCKQTFLQFFSSQIKAYKIGEYAQYTYMPNKFVHKSIRFHDH